ncbi:hypothetical protein PNOK_0977400 [Pyrrhoderma noxium]|uniref:Uncharacterized protein n=1 Tax=Pyrrhoderma noxium TaxID=2282107 RepID=A0A286U541_9AGAM|nr:hypothetical protein PNOK_0977400 [Pyrrhoderma noxium]
MVYARAPPSFQARYFSFRPPPIASPLPFGTSPTLSLPMPATSALSHNLGADFSYNASVRSVSPSNFRPTSPAPSVIGSLTRISSNHNPALFSNELEYLYTGKGFCDAFEFLFGANEKNASESEADEARIAKLRKDVVDIMENDGMVRFEDGERVEWVMDSIRRGMNDNNVVKLYQALVSAVLLRPHPQESDKSLLSSTSQIRVQVEQTRIDILRVNPGGPITRTGLRPTLSRVEDVTERDSMSTNHSLGTSVLNKNHTRTGTPSQIQSSSASVRSVARSVASTKSRSSSQFTSATARERKESRPDSKFVPFGGRSISPTVNRAPSVNSIHSATDVDEEDTPSNSRHASTATSPTLSSARRASITKGHRPRICTSNIKDTSDTASVLTVHERNVVTVQRSKSTASVTSTRSHASTIRRNTANTIPSSTTQQTLRPPPSPVRSTSSLSNASLSSPKDDSTSAYRTPRDSMTSRDSIARSRKISTASTTSNVSMRSTGTSRSPRIVTAPSLPKAPSEVVGSPKPVLAQQQQPEPHETVASQRHQQQPLLQQRRAKRKR